MNITANNFIERIDIIDRLFDSLDIEELRKFVELEENVVKLKGKDQHIGFIRQLIEEHNNMVLQISCLQIQLSTLRADLFSVINKIDDMYIK